MRQFNAPFVNARLWCSPHEIWTIFLVASFLASFGSGSFVSNSPYPNWPNEFEPQVNSNLIDLFNSNHRCKENKKCICEIITYPHSLIAHECEEPQQILVITWFSRFSTKSERKFVSTITQVWLDKVIKKQYCCGLESNRQVNVYQRGVWFTFAHNLFSNSYQKITDSMIQMTWGNCELLMSSKLIVARLDFFFFWFLLSVFFLF